MLLPQEKKSSPGSLPAAPSPCQVFDLEAWNGPRVQELQEALLQLRATFHVSFNEFRSVLKQQRNAHLGHRRGMAHWHSALSLV